MKPGGGLFPAEYNPNDKAILRAKMTLETDITKAILKDLRAMRVFCFKHWGGPMGMKGVSDILGVLPGGRFLALAVKMAKGRLTPAQAAFLQSVAMLMLISLDLTKLTLVVSYEDNFSFAVN